MENRIGFGKRLGALLIDCVICGIVVGVAGPLIGGFLGASAGATLGGMGAGTNAGSAAMTGGAFGAIAGALVGAVVIFVVYFLLEGFTGWTLGKLILGIQVANADGTAASVTTLLTRFAVKNIGSILRVVALVTGIRALFALGSFGGLIIFIGCFFTLGMAR